MADDFIQLPGMPHGDKGDGSKTATYAKTQGTDTVHLSRVMIEDDDGAVDLATQTTLITLATEETVATLGTEETLSAISGKLNQDEVVGALVTIETTHHEIHEGEMFSHAEVTNLANGAIRNLLIVTSTKEDHLFFTVTAESECDVKFYEGATASNNGTGISEFNRNRPLAATHTPLTTSSIRPPWPAARKARSSIRRTSDQAGAWAARGGIMKNGY